MAYIEKEFFSCILSEKRLRCIVTVSCGFLFSAEKREIKKTHTFAIQKNTFRAKTKKC